MFDHKKMSQASIKLHGQPSPVEADLQKVIEAFTQLQQHRLTADYDFGTNWSRDDVKEILATADESFKIWRTIRKEKVAQDHLLTMFGARRP
jgi:hypothetical protein